MVFATILFEVKAGKRAAMASGPIINIFLRNCEKKARNETAYDVGVLQWENSSNIDLRLTADPNLKALFATSMRLKFVLLSQQSGHKQVSECAAQAGNNAFFCSSATQTDRLQKYSKGMT